MPMFRKKPVVIEARLWEDTDAQREEFAAWFEKHHEVFETNGPKILISTEEGVMAADVGDWIIRGTSNEFYPCKPHIFEQVYEPAPSS
jgi:hypothetical protein